MQRLKIKQIQVRFKSKSMVIFYGETWSILQTAWLNCSKVDQTTVSKGRFSSEIQLLERMNNCSTCNQSQQLSACRTTDDNVERVLQAGLESQK